MSRVLSIANLRLLCVLVGLGGVALVIGGVPGTETTGWPVAVVAPGSGLTAASIAGLVTLRGVQTWREKQAEHAATATRENRSRVYESVLGHVVASFAGGAPTTDEAKIRAMAASWASTETLNALADWFRYARAHMGAASSVKPYSFEFVYRIVVAMRADIDPGSDVAKDDLLRMIFNDYDPSAHNPDGVSEISVDMSGAVIDG